MSPIPTGTVTFLFTDIEGSVDLWEHHHAQMQVAFARHEAILRQVITEQGGYAYKMIGDAFQVAFDTASKGLSAALSAQQRLQAEPWGETPIRVRMALHTGVTEERGDDYVGPALNRLGRLLSAGYGGQVLLTQATCDLVWDDLPSGVSLRDLGEHRFKDLTRAEHVYQLVTPDLLTDFPPLKSLDTFPNNLPIQLTSFIGRETEIEAIKQLVGTDRVRLLTLTGAGGTGKTRLALQVAADLLETFKDGVWLVELAPLADPDLVPPTVAAVLKVRELPSQPVMRALSEYLQVKQLLLILDNCEHVVEACGNLVSALLQTCPNLHILATSREILGTKGELPYRVPSLSTPDIRPMPPFEQLSQSEAVRLFAERASLAAPGFSLVPANAPVITRICHRLDGIPLAIELAVARLRHLSVEQIASRLDDSFRLLTGGSRTVLPRHQTLKALIDWSFNLLSKAERTLLLQLSVFAGGWRLEAAEKVCSSKQVFELLAQLVDKSLVLAAQAQDSSRAGNEMRYRMLETIRQYAHERLLEASWGEAVRDRHLDYFLELARQAEPNLRARDQIIWLDRLEEELDNLRLALEWSLAKRCLDGLSLGAALMWFWHIRGYGSEGIDRLQLLLEAENKAQGNQPRIPACGLQRAHALNALSFLLSHQYKLDRAKAAAEESLVIFKELGQTDQRGMAAAWLYLGLNTSDSSQSLSLCRESLTIFRKLNDQFNISECLQDIGVYQQSHGEFSEARKSFEESLALRRELGDQDGMGTILRFIGVIAISQGDNDQAWDMYDQALACFRAVNNVQMITLAIFNLAWASWFKGDYDQAARLWEEVIGIGQEQGIRQTVGSAYHVLGYVAWSIGDYALAQKRSEEALAVGQETGNQALINNSHFILAKVALSQRDFALAHDQISKVFTMVRNYNYLVGDNNLLAFVAILAAAWNQLERSVRLFAAAEHTCYWAVNLISPKERTERTGTLAAVRAALGEEGFAAAWAEGQAMSVERAMAYARQTLTKEKERWALSVNE